MKAFGAEPYTPKRLRLDMDSLKMEKINPGSQSPVNGSLAGHWLVSAATHCVFASRHAIYQLRIAEPDFHRRSSKSKLASPRVAIHGRHSGGHCNIVPRL